MCGRYSLTTPAEAVRAYFDYPERPNLVPRVNIAPRQSVAAVRLGSGESESAGDDGRHIVFLRWGLIPAWAKDAAIGDRMINARAESIVEKPAFRAAFRARRCLIAADGFYEWRSEGGRKQPYRITLADSEVIAFAGIWERWRDPQTSETVETCAIITTEAIPALRPIHHRMPVVVDPGDFAAWLNPATAAEAAHAVLNTPTAQTYIAYPVSTRINNAANDDLALLKPIEPVDPNKPADAQARLL